jgi:hypothetical protein
MIVGVRPRDVQPANADELLTSTLLCEVTSLKKMGCAVSGFHRAFRLPYGDIPNFFDLKSIGDCMAD